MKNELVKRSARVEMRAKEDGKTIVGIPIVFNQETIIEDWAGRYKEIIEPTALDKADLSDVCFFVNHDTSKIPMARSKKGKGTLKFSIESDGLHMEANLDTENNMSAREAYSAVDRGDLDGMSFMFRVNNDEWSDLDSDLPTRRIKGISIVHEVSAVTWPAYPQTSIDARSQESEHSALAEAREAFENKKALEIEKIRFQIRNRKGH